MHFLSFWVLVSAALLCKTLVHSLVPAQCYVDVAEPFPTPMPSSTWEDIALPIRGAIGPVCMQTIVSTRVAPGISENDLHSLWEARKYALSRVEVDACGVLTEWTTSWKSVATTHESSIKKCSTLTTATGASPCRATWTGVVMVLVDSLPAPRFEVTIIQSWAFLSPGRIVQTEFGRLAAAVKREGSSFIKWGQWPPDGIRAFQLGHPIFSNTLSVMTTLCTPVHARCTPTFWKNGQQMGVTPAAPCALPLIGSELWAHPTTACECDLLSQSNPLLSVCEGVSVAYEEASYDFDFDAVGVIAGVVAVANSAHPTPISEGLLNDTLLWIRSFLNERGYDESSVPTQWLSGNSGSADNNTVVASDLFGVALSVIASGVRASEYPPFALRVPAVLVSTAPPRKEVVTVVVVYAITQSTAGPGNRTSNMVWSSQSVRSRNVSGDWVEVADLTGMSWGDVLASPLCTLIPEPCELPIGSIVTVSSTQSDCVVTTGSLISVEVVSHGVTESGSNLGSNTITRTTPVAVSGVLFSVTDPLLPPGASPIRRIAFIEPQDNNGNSKPMTDWEVNWGNLSDSGPSAQLIDGVATSIGISTRMNYSAAPRLWRPVILSNSSVWLNTERDTINQACVNIIQDAAFVLGSDALQAAAVWWSPIGRATVSVSITEAVAVVLIEMWVVQSPALPAPHIRFSPIVGAVANFTATISGVQPVVAVERRGSLTQNTAFSANSRMRDVTTGLAFLCRTDWRSCGGLSGVDFGTDFPRPAGLIVPSDVANVSGMVSNCAIGMEGTYAASVNPVCMLRNEISPFDTRIREWREGVARSTGNSTTTGPNEGFVLGLGWVNDTMFAASIGIVCPGNQVTCTKIDGLLLAEPCRCQCYPIYENKTIASGSTVCTSCGPSTVRTEQGVCVRCEEAFNGTECSLSGSLGMSKLNPFSENSDCQCNCKPGFTGLTCRDCAIGPEGQTMVAVVVNGTGRCESIDTVCGEYGSWDMGAQRCVCSKWRAGALCESLEPEPCPVGHVATNSLATDTPWCVCADTSLKHPVTGQCMPCPELGFQTLNGTCVFAVLECPEVPGRGLLQELSLASHYCVYNTTTSRDPETGLCIAGYVETEEGVCESCEDTCGGSAVLVCSAQETECVCSENAGSPDPPCVELGCSEDKRIGDACFTCSATCILSGGECVEDTSECRCPHNGVFVSGVGCRECPAGTLHNPGPDVCAPCTACRNDGAACDYEMDPNTACVECRPGSRFSPMFRSCVACTGMGLKCGALGVCVTDDSLEEGCACADGSQNVCEYVKSTLHAPASWLSECCVPCEGEVRQCALDALCQQECLGENQECVVLPSGPVCSCRIGYAALQRTSGAPLVCVRQDESQSTVITCDTSHGDVPLAVAGVTVFATWASLHLLLSVCAVLYLLLSL